MSSDAVGGAPVRSSVTMMMERAGATPFTETTEDVYRTTEAA
jgi:hypothetical protein